MLRAPSPQMGIEMALPCNFAAGACNASMSAYVAAYAQNLGDNITAGARARGASRSRCGTSTPSPPPHLIPFCPPPIRSRRRLWRARRLLPDELRAARGVVHAV